MRLSALVLAAACASSAGCVLTAQPRLDRPAFQRGVAIGLFNEDRAEAERALDEVRDLGANSVSLVITWVQDDLAAPSVRRDPRFTASDELIRVVVARARRLGLAVTLFPLVKLLTRTAAEWRGQLRPRDLGAWFASYGAEVEHLARIGAQAHALSIGSELNALEDETSAWLELIARVRRVSPLRLLYSANWDHYRHVRFWGELDEIGLSAYWDMAKPGEEVTPERAALAWAPIRAELSRFQREVGRPFVFTEVGYPSVRGAAAAPWNDFLAGADGVEDPETQRRLYEAFITAWNDQPELAGVFFWIWLAPGGLGDRGYSPRHKPAELVVRQWFRPAEQLPPPR